MPTHPVQLIIDGQPTFEKPVQEILAELKEGGALKTLSPLEYITDQQRKWWKGVLLPALAKDSGDTIDYWEAKLKLAVLPDEFMPIEVVIKSRQVNDKIFHYIPSVTKLSKRKMNLLIEGSVAQCHDWGFLWVTLPDSELRK